jgi:hypothetical protein
MLREDVGIACLAMIEDITMSSFFSEVSLQQTLIALQRLGLWCLMPLSTIFVFAELLFAVAQKSLFNFLQILFKNCIYGDLIVNAYEK